MPVVVAQSLLSRLRPATLGSEAKRTTYGTHIQSRDDLNLFSLCQDVLGLVLEQRALQGVFDEADILQTVDVLWACFCFWSLCCETLVQTVGLTFV